MQYASIIPRFLWEMMDQENPTLWIRFGFSEEAALHGVDRAFSDRPGTPRVFANGLQPGLIDLPWA